MAQGPKLKLIPIGMEKFTFGDVPKVFTLLHDGIRDQSAEGVRFMSQYPPAAAKSRYVRTGVLRLSWSFQVKSGGGRIEGSINSNSNIAPYNEEVQGSDQSDVFARIGWRNTKDLESKIDKDFPKIIQDLVGRAFK